MLSFESVEKNPLVQIVLEINAFPHITNPVLRALALGLSRSSQCHQHSSYVYNFLGSFSGLTIPG